MSHSPPLPCLEPFHCWGELVSGSTVGPVGTAWTLIWSYSFVCLPPMSTAARARVFSLWEHSLSFPIFHRHRVYLVNHVDLIFNLCRWWKTFQSSSLATPLLELSCGFSPTPECRPPTRVCSWGCPEGLGSAPMRIGHGSGMAAWIVGGPMVPGVQGSWWSWCKRCGSTRSLF